MANLDHAAIIKAYPDAAVVDDFTGSAFKEDGTPITLVQSAIAVSYTHLTLPTNREV